MRNVSHIAIAFFALAVSLGGCAQKRATPVAKTAPTPPPTSPAQADPSQAQPQEKTPKHGETAVFVDGKQVGVLRSLELPAALKSRTVSLGGGYEATRWAFTDYAAAIGIDIKKVKALHLYGGSRVVVIDAAELAREGDGLRFGFLQGDRGKVRAVFPPMKLHTNTTIDLLSRVAFYIDKEPPHLDKPYGGDLVMPDGSKVGERGPYVESDSGSGTRVYVDGQLVGAVKRKKLTNDIVVSGDSDSETKFSLAGYEGKVGVDASKAKEVDLIAGDDVVARMGADDVKTTSFSVPRKNQGKMLVDLKTTDGTKVAKVTAVQIFVKSKPPTRNVTALEDAPEANPSFQSGGGGGGGGGGSTVDDE